MIMVEASQNKKDKTMANGIVYRKLVASEKEAYHKIRLDCLQKHPENFGTLFEEEQVLANFKFDAIIAQNNSIDFLMGAFSENKLIGICGFIQEKRQKTAHIGELNSMYVMPEFGGQHIGTGLLKSTIQRAFENPFLEQIILAVAEKNNAARNLYQKNGFEEYGRLENYFKYKGAYETQIFMVIKKTEQ
jgi:RimJ/RimL family protein N-acetyltransferase